MLIDSHCHLNMLDLGDFGGSLDNVIKLANEAGVQHMLCVCVELEDFPELQKIAQSYSNITISVGIHPNTELDDEPSVEKLIALGRYAKCIAIGETGLDYYRNDSIENKNIQQLRFRNHIKAALDLNKPLIIHTRNAAVDTIQLMQSERASEIGGVMHCFAESWEVAKQALDLNFYISFSGIVTFKSAANLHAVAQKVPLDRILIETDSPYLAPVPHRGRQNHPALVRHVAESIATLRGIEYEQVARITTQNFADCFRTQI